MKEKVQPINKSSMYSAMIGLCFITIAVCWIIRMFGYRGFDLDMTNVELPTFMYYLINGIFTMYLLHMNLYSNHGKDPHAFIAMTRAFLESDCFDTHPEERVCKFLYHLGLDE